MRVKLQERLEKANSEIMDLKQMNASISFNLRQAEIMIVEYEEKVQD